MPSDPIPLADLFAKIDGRPSYTRRDLEGFEALLRRSIRLDRFIAAAEGVFPKLLSLWQNDQISETDIVLLMTRLVTHLRQSRSSRPTISKPRKWQRVFVANLPIEPHFVLAPLAAEYLMQLGYAVEYWTGTDESELARRVRAFGHGSLVLTVSPVFARDHLADRYRQTLAGLRAKGCRNRETVLLGQFGAASEMARETAGFDQYCTSVFRLPVSSCADMA